MIAIVFWTLWERRWFIFWWAVGATAFMVLSLIFYPTFRDQAAQFNEVISRLPETARSLFAGTSGLATAEDFLSARVFYLMLPLILSILSIIVGSSLIAKEETSGTLELLLARPVSRSRLLLAKAVAGAIILAVIALVSLIVALVVGQLVNIEVAIINIEVAVLAAAVLALLFGAIAFLITAVGRWARTAAAGAAAFLALGSYIIVSLSSTVEWLRYPAKILPHNYYRPNEILYGHFGWQNIVGILAVCLVLFGIAWQSFKHRDIGV